MKQQSVFEAALPRRTGARLERDTNALKIIIASVNKGSNYRNLAATVSFFTWFTYRPIFV